MIFFIYFFFFCKSHQYQESKLSVIIPVHNSESSISRCLNSVLNQTLRDIEVICVDDGSLDRSLEILDNIAEKDERVIVLHQENCGFSCARNAGLALAHGTYVGFVDSDDWIESDLFRSVFEEARENGVDVVEFGFLWGNKIIVMPSAFRLPEKTGKFSNKIFRGIDAAKYFLPGHAINMTWSKIYRKSLIKDNGILFDKSIQAGEDLLFNVDLIPFVDSVLCIRKVFYHYHWIKDKPVFLYRKHCRLLADGLRRHMEKIKKTKNCKNQISEETLEDIKKEITKYWEMSEEKKNNEKKLITQNPSLEKQIRRNQISEKNPEKIKNKITKFRDMSRKRKNNRKEFTTQNRLLKKTKQTTRKK